MRNTITLNGTESSEITGLLIQSLSPISKPLMRTEIEEIDGRDGDIVTPLGFSAYDKEITIGLYGDFDIDEVIAYFTSSGTVTFSNEPDKYYYYQIINQIDFERLLRYRTATVTLHVQPFKYSTEENAKTFNVNSGGANLFTGDFTVKNYGQGLPTTDSGYITINSYTSDSVNFTYTNNTYTFVLSDTIELEPNTTYTISFFRTDSVSDKNNRNYIYNVDANGNYSSNPGLQNGFFLQTGNVSKTFTTGSTGKVAFAWGCDNTANGRTVIISNICLQLGTISRLVSISNSGNYFSRPTLTLTGSGTINLSLNNNQIFVVDMGDTASTITIDTAAMEAYQGTPDTLMNRSVDGDYNNFKLNVGSNTISWSGNLTKIVINNYSRWI